MKFIIPITFFLINTTAYSNVCPEKRTALKETSNRLEKLKQLKIKNEDAYSKTSNSLKKIKISSNLIIISNKSKKAKVEIDKLTTEFKHCFIEDT